MSSIYLAHAFSAPTEMEMEANRANASLWAIAIAKLAGCHVSADWIWMTRALKETEYNREFGLWCDKRAIDNCCGIVLCGPQYSNGMRVEHAYAEGMRKQQWNMLVLGPEPPTPADTKRWYAFTLICASIRGFTLSQTYVQLQAKPVELAGEGAEGSGSS